MDKLFDIRHNGTFGRELSKESFILFAIQHKDFRVKTVEYTISHNVNEEILVTSHFETGDNQEMLCTTMSMLIDYLGKIYSNAVSMTLEEIRDELLTKEDNCDRVMLSSLMATVGYLNCQIERGYDCSDEEMKYYMDFLNDLA